VQLTFNFIFDIRNPTPSIAAYLLEKQSCLVSSRSDVKRGAF